MKISNKVNIVAVNDGWILSEIAKKLNQGLAYTNWTEKPIPGHKVTYYINYAQARNERVSRIECALFTHIEESNAELIKKWWNVAKSTDVPICMSKFYTKKLRKKKIESIVIPPGVDLNKFTLRPLRIGVVGSVKNTGRKGEKLISKVMDIPGIEWRFTGGDGWPGNAKYLKQSEMPKFYADLDYVLIASYYEGGPMCAIEALAIGIPIIGPNVGWVSELPHIHYKIGNEKSLRKILTKLIEEKNKLRNSVLDRSWENFIFKHDILFKELFNLEQVNASKKMFRKVMSKVRKLS